MEYYIAIYHVEQQLSAMYVILGLILVSGKIGRETIIVNILKYSLPGRGYGY